MVMEGLLPVSFECPASVQKLSKKRIGDGHFHRLGGVDVSAAPSRTSGAGFFRRLQPPQPPAPFTGLVTRS